eukprot:CAMPEP_0197673836 /NCGR_PEP_ID=MMETSP1338-20131121/81767_1 /TAXON_ID=43686 ORGANISM="Pelagodinium beii, Strain RCC1491" /NCGR_SAMPLE_ID=MMETSP1338 /ASSEMBLY_ACC=CAM_ASM_000754 /LENGTH=53 /DNA_ID=CAMNT_0043254139 /DNA_START=39 /DNA_END=197 /DNA_ORIENTATION=-
MRMPKLDSGVNGAGPGAGGALSLGGGGGGGGGGGFPPGLSDERFPGDGGGGLA